MAEKTKKTPKKAVKKEKPEVATLPGKKYMRPDEVAEYLNIHRSTVYLWCDHGKLEHCKLSDGVMRVLTESVKQLEKNGMLKAVY